MAKKVIGFNLDEETINGIDEIAEKMGISRSRLVDMTLKTAFGGQSVHDFTRWLFADVDRKEETQSNTVTV